MMSEEFDPKAAPAYYQTAADLPAWVSSPGGQHPGVFPFLRGIHPRMYTERPWRMRQYAGFGTAAETNQRWKRLLEQGQHGVSCAFDLPTQLGLDSDDPRAAADAGRLGVAISTLEDFVELFDGIPLHTTAATFNVNASAAVVYAMLLETLERQGVDPAALTGTLSNDPLIEFIARGLWGLPPVGALRLMADTFEYSLAHTPSFYPINLRATLVYEAGGSATQELAFGLACARAYLDGLRERGADMEQVTARFSFLHFADTNLLEEAAKFRAARMLWADEVRERYGVRGESGQRLRFTAAIGNFNLRAQIPELNLVRTSLGALGAVLGGCQAMLVAGLDEAFEIPSERSSLLGLYTQQVIALESRVTGVVDPLGGSYYLESTTERIRGEVLELLETVERQGGAIAAIERGALQRAIGDAAYRFQLAEESGLRPVVGVNTPGSERPHDPEFALHVHDAGHAAGQRRRLDRTRRERDAGAVKRALEQLAVVLASPENCIPAIREVVRRGGTLGEVTAVCVQRYGEYREPVEV